MTGGHVDVVLSDMSPNISGSYSMDHARSVELCEMALSFALATLSRNGKLVFKMFEGDMSRDLLAEVQKHFDPAIVKAFLKRKKIIRKIWKSKRQVGLFITEQIP